MTEAWDNLRVGDHIRVVRIPSDVDAPGYTFHPETRRLYKKLIERGRPLRICAIDEFGRPSIRCRIKRRDGRWEHHLLMVNDDSWVKVKKRS